MYKIFHRIPLERASPQRGDFHKWSSHRGDFGSTRRSTSRRSEMVAQTTRFQMARIFAYPHSLLDIASRSALRVLIATS